MEFINDTRMASGFNMGLEPSARELLVVVIKGTFVLPRPGEQVRLADEQIPLIMADTFTGEPGLSALVQEMDFAPRKHACDVLLTGHARAPHGKAVTRMHVSLRVGPIEKNFNVVGDRVWNARLGTFKASEPLSFTEMLVSYDRAFGGADLHSENAAEHDTYLSNPVGRGWHKHLNNDWVDGSPLPNIEAVGEGVSFPSDKRLPIALGPLGRSWPQRARFAGTYDDAWLDDVFPFLPHDFNERYYQAAPDDQQVPLPKGPMEVVLSGFTTDGLRQFTLPHLIVPVQVFPKRGEREDLIAKLDTIAFDTDAERFTMSWRVVRPLKNSLHEIAQGVAGTKGRAWWQQREQVSIVAPVQETVNQQMATSDALKTR